MEPFFAAHPEPPQLGNAKHDKKHGLLSREFLAYAATLLHFPKGTFDIIVVDGMARCLTAWLAGQYLKEGGFIVFDNADRWQYNTAYRYLSSLGFKRIDFYGPGPYWKHEWCTSIFAKDLEPFASNVEIPRGSLNDLNW
jgi:hypothetical protein